MEQNEGKTLKLRMDLIAERDDLRAKLAEANKDWQRSVKRHVEYESALAAAKEELNKWIASHANAVQDYMVESDSAERAESLCREKDERMRVVIEAAAKYLEDCARVFEENNMSMSAAECLENVKELRVSIFTPAPSPEASNEAKETPQ
jgi:hypothetical protein